MRPGGLYTVRAQQAAEQPDNSPPGVGVSAGAAGVRGQLGYRSAGAGFLFAHQTVTTAVRTPISAPKSSRRSCSSKSAFSCICSFLSAG